MNKPEASCSICNKKIKGCKCKAIKLGDSVICPDCYIRGLKWAIGEAYAVNKIRSFLTGTQEQEDSEKNEKT